VLAATAAMCHEFLFVSNMLLEVNRPIWSMKSGNYRGKFLCAGVLENNRPIRLVVTILVGVIKVVSISFQVDRESAFVFEFL
jgi:hypothetical protein